MMRKISLSLAIPLGDLPNRKLLSSSSSGRTKLKVLDISRNSVICISGSANGKPRKYSCWSLGSTPILASMASFSSSMVAVAATSRSNSSPARVLFSSTYKQISDFYHKFGMWQNNCVKITFWYNINCFHDCRTCSCAWQWHFLSAYQLLSCLSTTFLLISWVGRVEGWHTGLDIAIVLYSLGYHFPSFKLL